MRIKQIQINNYKSFLASDVLELTPGFNIIVGANNVGKTALAEALGSSFQNNPHRSLITIPYSGTQVEPNSSIKLCIQLDEGDFLKILTMHSQNSFRIPTLASGNPSMQRKEALETVTKFNEGFEITFMCIAGGFESFELGTIQSQITPNFKGSMTIELKRLTKQLEPKVHGAYDAKQNVLFDIRQQIRQRVYRFSPERLNIGQTTVSNSKDLNSNASNLAAVLNQLQTANYRRFKRLVDYTKAIFPLIQDISVPPSGNNNVEVKIWEIDPESERSDLAIPLSESGTGLGHVLSILYVVLNSDHPSVIIIDEPQSYLHPGAVRKLINILHQHPQHQYIIATHAADVITATNPENIILVRKKDSESYFEQIDASETQKLRLFLSELGVRLYDVFGADNVLWVEGPTEEQCFPIILREIVKHPALGTVVLGVLNTGDLEGKDADRVYEIYRRLSSGSGRILPPAIGFIFDREMRTQEQIDDLKRKSNGDMHFLLRRMYENYLLNSKAIVHLMSTLENFSDTPIESKDIDEWVEEHRFDSKFYSGVSPDASNWLDEVHGAKLLNAMFRELSETRYEYDKIAYGLELTKWIVNNEPDELNEIVELLREIVTSPTDS